MSLLLCLCQTMEAEPPDKLLRHLNCLSKKIKVLWGGRPARPEYTI